MHGESRSPVLGRESPASAREPSLPASGDAAGASWRLEAGSTGWCTLRAASVVGVRHRLAGRPAEDWFAWSHGSDRLTVAVADGVGSSRGAAAAAARAARAAVLGGGTPPGALVSLEEALDAANRAVAGQPGDDGAEVEVGEGADPGESGVGATTLVVAAVSRGGEVHLARVGDSTAFRVGADGSWQELFAPPAADIVGTETFALPAEALDPAWARIVLDPGDALVLASDGVADPWRDGPTTVAPALAAGVAGRPSALELGRLANFSRQGCHDDRTFVCVWLGQDSG